MALYFPRAHATFIHIPKTAGLSFEAWASEINHINYYRRNTRHITAEDFRAKIREPGKVFTFVRNPWSRMVSYYYWLFDDVVDRIRRRAEGETFKLITPEQDLEWLTIMSKGFDAWLHEVYNRREDDLLARIYLSQQCNYIHGEEDVLTIKLENIKRDFSKIQTLLNWYEPLPIRNASSHRNYRSYYSHYGRLLIARLFAEDIERFGYTFSV